MTDTLEAPRTKGPIVWMGMDQTELDNAYDQAVYAPNQPLVHARRAAANARAKARLGAPQRFQYGASEIESVDVYRTQKNPDNAPINVYIHGGAWRNGRSADFVFLSEMIVDAGAHAVIAPKDRAVGLTAAAIKVASGAADTVAYFMITNLARTMRDLKERNIWLIGAAEDASQSLFAGRLTGALGLVLGAEGPGLRRLTREHCDEMVAIPMFGAVASLNVSVATGICLFEARRQRESVKK